MLKIEESKDSRVAYIREKKPAFGPSMNRIANMHSLIVLASAIGNCRKNSVSSAKASIPCVPRPSASADR